MKNGSFIHSDFQSSKHTMPESVASNVCGEAPKDPKVARYTLKFDHQNFEF